MAYNTSATFYPGGDDSYYVPEMVQPAPHRPGDHPTNMPHNVAQMENAAQGGHHNQSSNGWHQSPMPPRIDSYQPPHDSYASPASSGYTTATPTSVYSQQSPATYQQPAPPVSQTYQQPPTSGYQQPSPQPPQTYDHGQQYSTGLPETPNFSPFPALRNPPPNIPPTDEQKEDTLEKARQAVLACNDPEVQLTWAQDVLQYAEIAQQNEQRISLTQNPRPRTPRIEKQLRDDALKITNFLADQHHPKAEFMRGTWLEFGRFGERVDKKEAFHCYSRAAEKGYVRAHYRIGMQFEASQDALKAIKYYQRGVDAGDAASCYRLGMMTLLGQHGQFQDFEHGINLIYKSAEAADDNAPQGAYVYGMLKAGELSQVHVPERFCPKDTVAAKTNIEKAAYLGFSKAQVRMGAAYELGELGCPFDPALSLHYNALAARQGETEAEMAISKWFLCGHEGVFEKNEEMAFTYAQRAAVSGLGTAQFAMGYFYEVGIYVSPDYSTAQEWYRKAAEAGNADAAGRVEAIKRSKTLSRKDHEAQAVSRIKQSRPNVNVGSTAATLDMPDPSRLSLNTNSSAPYPSGPPGMPQSTSHPDFRPASAFGVNPNLRPNSATGYGSPQQQMYPPQNRPSPQPYGNGQGSYGPPGPVRGSAPPQQYGGPGGGRPSPRPGTTSPHQQPTNRPPVDIGYIAPLEQRQPRPPHPAEAPRPRPSPGPGMHGGGPGGRPPPQQRPIGHQQPSPAPQKQPQKPQQPQQKPMPQQQQKPVQPTGPQQKPNKVAPSRIEPGKISQGQGPNTFEAMGIPNKKAKGDCIVM
ncbi:Chitin synthase regulatory factor 4 [Cyphellophora attinorum]|uniref:Chitin synthase regulatory factor 4 n=1 Tax=Cyphellophora attinorum TaxID=1664694 RepID=A0A0N1NXM5_9EURO|nr:Chitin synthase regulatory factor 4 [Phialophora attinorum]KPI35207.1 Chitin synthase regulatory factor 4 [Phialophora attinorum]